MEKILAYQKAGEEVRDAAFTALLHSRDYVSLEEGREMRDRVLQGEVDGAAAERAILSMTDIGILRIKSIS